MTRHSDELDRRLAERVVRHAHDLRACVWIFAALLIALPVALGVLL